MMMRGAKLWLVSLLLITLTACTAPSAQPTQSVELTRQFESSAFLFDYPETWQYQIPQANLLFLASPDVLAQRPGATLTIQRTISFASSANLEDALNTYLARGPLRADRHWQAVTEVESLVFDTYDAVSILVEGSEQADSLPMRSRVYLLQAESGFFFIMTATAPVTQWDTVQPTFDAIFASMDLLE
ncbi:MAG: hypothetical protein ACFE0Q_12225 [Anaerolineae bacterium]